ncbi:MAG: tetratricopeptide repeat protein [Chromatiaceae bacterium]
MPRLTPLQWLIALIFLAFYGFAVFAVTRDYYVRHPIRPPAPVTAAPHDLSGSQRSFGIGSALEAVNPIPSSIEESDPRLLEKKADSLFAERRYLEAIPVYRRILELAPGDMGASNDLGLALHYGGDTTGALELLRSASSAAPTFQRIWLTLGFVTLQSGDSAGAREILTRARDLGPDNPIGQEASRLLGTTGKP